jgi:hypothetical protein
MVSIPLDNIVERRKSLLLLEPILNINLMGRREFGIECPDGNEEVVCSSITENVRKLQLRSLREGLLPSLKPCVDALCLGSLLEILIYTGELEFAGPRSRSNAFLERRENLIGHLKVRNKR